MESDHRYTSVESSNCIHLQADVILAVTCAVRENAEKKVWYRLDFFQSLKRARPRNLPPLKVGVLGEELS